MNKLHIPRWTNRPPRPPWSIRKFFGQAAACAGKAGTGSHPDSRHDRQPAPRLKNKTVVLFASDHHIADHGLSLTSTDVTYIQTRNFLQGGGTINAFTRNAGARLTVVDVGVNYDFGDLPGLVKRKSHARRQ